jgi:hypothetical protein
VNLLKTAFVACMAVALTGCATVTRGRTQDFVINTVPSGANARLSTGETCVTPCTLRRPRNEEFSVTISKDGFETTTVMVDHRTGGGGGTAMAGNVLIGGLIGAGVDAASGATQDLYPNPLEVNLVRVQPNASPAATTPEANGQPTS